MGENKIRLIIEEALAGDSTGDQNPSPSTLRREEKRKRENRKVSSYNKAPVVEAHSRLVVVVVVVLYKSLSVLYK